MADNEPIFNQNKGHEAHKRVLNLYLPGVGLWFWFEPDEFRFEQNLRQNLDAASILALDIVFYLPHQITVDLFKLQLQYPSYSYSSHLSYLRFPF